MRKLNKLALRRALWGSIGRVIGVMIGAGGGVLLHELLGNNLTSYGIGLLMVVVGFIATVISEYERERS